jgi:polyphenol oxidase
MPETASPFFWWERGRPVRRELKTFHMQTHAADAIGARMADALTMTFPALEALPGLAHGFTLRHPTIDVLAEKNVVVERLWAWHHEQVEALGFTRENLRTAEQVHGGDVRHITQESAAHTENVDGLITATPAVMLGIYVADCCAVYLADPVTGGIGLVHSGKKGTEAAISVNAIRLMADTFGSRAQDIIVQLSPCIRPPAYEVDFAAAIRAQCLDAGILPQNLHDTGLCTSSDAQHYYSYRMEKGKTGRMLALLGRRSAVH